jgi:hypothetical protein
MKNNVTEGAIVQHLAKLRSRRVAAGKEVPPSLRRGGIGSSNKSPKIASGAKHRLQSSQSLGSEEDEGLELNLCDDSSDEDYVDKGRRKNRRKKKIPHTQKYISRPRETARSEYEVGLKQESENSDDGTEELLVPGADFLQYPNDKEVPNRLTSPQAPEASESKVIVLRYRRSAGEQYSGLSSAYEQSGVRALQTYGSINQHAPYQRLQEPGFGMDTRYILGYSPMPPIGSGGPIPNLPSFGEIQGFPSTPYSGYQNPVYYHPTDDSARLTSDMVGDTGSLYNSNYPYLQGDYTDSNENSILDHQDNLEMKS